jgi:hypothetical protein
MVFIPAIKNSPNPLFDNRWGVGSQSGCRDFRAKIDGYI